jgi:hypothetical protein
MIRTMLGRGAAATGSRQISEMQRTTDANREGRVIEAIPVRGRGAILKSSE